MVEINSVVVNLDNALKAYQDVMEHNDDREWLEKHHLWGNIAVNQKYHLKGNITINRDAYHDGEVSVHYNTGTTQGLLRFSEMGNYDDGTASQNDADPNFTTILIALAFGEEEFTAPFPEEGRIFLDAAKAVYECYQKEAPPDDICFKNVNERKKIASDKKTDEAMSLANRMLKQAKKEDWGPGGYDATEVEAVIDNAAPQISIMPNDTAAASEARYQAARNMLVDITKTETGWNSCIDLAICTSETKKKSDYYGCDETTGAIFSSSWYLNGQFLKTYDVVICHERRGDGPTYTPE